MLLTIQGPGTFVHVGLSIDNCTLNKNIVVLKPFNKSILHVTINNIFTKSN